jgi:transposase
MTVPGVGAIVALTYVAAIDCPERFRSSKTVGACLGLTPRRYQSGETDRSGAITKMGDSAARGALRGSACHHDACGAVVSTQGLGPRYKIILD